MDKLFMQIKIVLKQLRIKHYIKNLIVFFPIFFSLNATKWSYIYSTILLFASFCCASSFVYVINDILDIEKDRLHPSKKNRPLASGKLKIKDGIIISVISLTISISLSLICGYSTIYFILFYIALNLLYSKVLKHIAIIDVSCIVLGFIIRLFAAGNLLNIPISNWLMLTVMAGAFYMGFGKRRNELIMNEKGENTRISLLSYNVNFLEKTMTTSMTLAITFYSLWAIDPNVAIKIGNDKLYLTVILVIIAFFRYNLTIENSILKGGEGDPVTVIYSDNMLKLIFLVYGLSMFIIIYVL